MKIVYHSVPLIILCLILVIVSISLSLFHYSYILRSFKVSLQHSPKGKREGIDIRNFHSNRHNKLHKV